jgi:predicted HicB family RNase H-like nuclease
MSNRKRSKNLNVRCVDDEIATFEVAAVARGLSLSAWVRMTLLDGAKKTKR